MLGHYREWYQDRTELPPILFLVGEQRRDIIPRTMMDKKLPADRRILVTELVVYGTGVVESFSKEFKSLLKEMQTRQVIWVVVFSPTGCDGMLDGLNMLDNSARARIMPRDEQHKVYVATIGPTTRDFLKEQFGFTPDVCASKPSPEGVWAGIIQHMSL